MPSSRALRALDLALALWVAAWIALGIAIGVNVDHLTRLSRTAVFDGHAVYSVGRSLGSLGHIPFIGGAISRDATEIQAAGTHAAAAGQASVSSIHALSVLLAIAVALLPSVPVFGFYLPARLERWREARALRAGVLRYGEDPAFQAFLASRAIAALSYHRLRQVSPSPWTDEAAGDHEALAAAELRRLGLDPALLKVANRSRA
jgi:hypothetical protein